MNIVWALFISALVVGYANGVAVDHVPAGSGVSRIVGGQPASITQYPSIVAVEFRYNFLWWYQLCAGNVLNHRHILAAAQCFTGFLFSINQRRIRAGSATRNSGGFVMEINRALNHPTFGKNDYDGDLTILYLESSLTFGLGVAPAIIPNQGFEVFDNAPVIHAGWGTTRIGGGGPESDHLQHVDVYTINHALCTQRYSELRRYPDVTNNMICSGLLNASERDACDADEGGPLYYNGDILIGIISWGYRCADAYYPRVNTKVSAYTDWIRANTNV